eukprot:scpid64000/ scgid15638/ 
MFSCTCASRIARLSGLELFRSYRPAAARYTSTDSTSTNFVDDGKWPGPFTKKGLPSMKNASNKHRLEELGFNNLDELIQSQVPAAGGHIEDSASQSQSNEVGDEKDVSKATLPSGHTEYLEVKYVAHLKWLLGNGFVDTSGCSLFFGPDPRSRGHKTIQIVGIEEDVKRCKDSVATLLHGSLPVRARTVSEHYPASVPVRPAGQPTSRASPATVYSHIPVSPWFKPPVLKYANAVFTNSELDIAYGVLYRDGALLRRVQVPPMSERDRKLATQASVVDQLSSTVADIQDQIRNVMQTPIFRSSLNISARVGHMGSPAHPSVFVHRSSKVSGRRATFQPCMPSEADWKEHLPERTSTDTTLTVMGTILGSSAFANQLFFSSICA